LNEMSARCFKSLLPIFISLLLALNLQAQSGKDTSSVYIHPTAPALNIHIIKLAARIFMSKNSLLEKSGDEHFVSEAAPIPRQLFSEFKIDTSRVCGRNVYIISPKEKASGQYVLYLHGGAYINNIFRQHWKFAEIVIRATHCTFVLPDYPLAPAATYQEAFVMLYAIYNNLLAKTQAGNIILMGDSAGGGLALALAEKQQKEGIPHAGHIILLSPWLDVSMTNPEIKEVEKKDAMLQANSLVEAGKVWAGNSDSKNYLVSPIYGSLEGLPPISLFIGTHDILMPDCRKLKTMMDQQGLLINYYEYPRMFHDWIMLTNLDESQVAISQIVSLIVKTTHSPN
jgi:acetyl esterase/lipase